MTAIKTTDIDRFIAKPDPGQPVVLVYGPDAGLVRERVDALVRASVDDPADPFALARIESEELSANPGRLADEANTVPLFGGRRAVLSAGQFAPQHRAVDRSRAGDAAARLPHRRRGRRAAQNRTAARAVREGQSRRRHRLLPGQRARPGAADRRGDARGEFDACRRRARGAHRAARRRPPRLAQRDPQARALCARARTASSSPTW